MIYLVGRVLEPWLFKRTLRAALAAPGCRAPACRLPRGPGFPSIFSDGLFVP